MERDVVLRACELVRGDFLQHAGQLVEQFAERLGRFIGLRGGGHNERPRGLAQVEARSHAGCVVAQRRIPPQAEPAPEDRVQNLDRKKIRHRGRRAHAADENP